LKNKAFIAGGIGAGIFLLFMIVLYMIRKKWNKMKCTIKHEDEDLQNNMTDDCTQPAADTINYYYGEDRHSMLSNYQPSVARHRPSSIARIDSDGGGGEYDIAYQPPTIVSAQMFKRPSV
jgi:hypothetical protein